MSVPTRMLLVDDNESLCKSLSMILKRKGIEVITCNNGSEAVDVIKHDTDFALILLDIKMPVMNGVETYKLMKEFVPNVPVFMMTAYSVDELIQEAIEEGVRAVLSKPVKIDDIIKLVGQAIEEQNGAYILIVDDDESIRSTFQSILERRGFRVKTAETGEKAIDLSKENEFDILFMDMKLPTLNGLETYLDIKKNKPNAVVIVITGHAAEMSSQIEQAILSSAYICLTKPVDMNQVFSLINEISSKKRSE